MNNIAVFSAKMELIFKAKRIYVVHLRTFAH